MAVNIINECCYFDADLIRKLKITQPEVKVYITTMRYCVLFFFKKRDFHRFSTELIETQNLPDMFYMLL